jgi:uncharacterized protein YndB with AHSA1/START domain
MSDARRETFIDAPVEVVWELVSDVNRHPEWWPRVVEVECEGMEEGCTYREVVKTSLGNEEMKLNVEELEDCENLSIRCLTTGTYVRFLLTEAQGGTFVEGRMGMDPKSLGYRAFDAVMGQRYFRNWLQQTVESLGEAARRRARERAPAE